MLPELGIGITYNFGLGSFLEKNQDLIDVLEVEPQTIWLRKEHSESGLMLNQSEFEKISSWPCHKLLHGIGYPVGGSIPPGDDQYPLLRHMIHSWNVPWMSEHLSYNKVLQGERIINTGFLLPPLQTKDGVAVATRSIKCMAENLPVPLIFETGVNYLKPVPFEMDDGQFVNAVSEAADCNILLDIHNLLCNQKNGRQSIDDFISQVSPERIIEVHIAGGREYKGYYLDAHSGIISSELEEITVRVIKQLPNLKAIFFEIFPTYVDLMTERTLSAEIERIRRIWDKRGTGQKVYAKHKIKADDKPFALEAPAVDSWEGELAALVLSQKQASWLGLHEDPGVEIMRELLFSFRASMVVRSIPYCFNYLLLSFGGELIESLLSRFFSKQTPEPFASIEALNFLRFLKTQKIKLKALSSLINYEMCLIKTSIDNQDRRVYFPIEPLSFLRAISEKRLPEQITPARFELIVEGIKKEQSADVELLTDSFNPVFHN